MSIHDEWEGIKFIWKIENFSYRNGCLRSLFGTTLPTAWKVGIYNYKNYISLLLEKLIVSRCEINCSVAFLNSDGKPLIRKEIKRSGCIGFLEFFDFIEIEKFNSNKAKFIPNDTLTIEFHIWRTPSGILSWFSVQRPVLCSSHTRIQDTTNVIKKKFTWDVDGVSSLQPGNSFERCEELGTFDFLQIRLILKGDNAFQVYFRTYLESTSRQANIEILMLDASGSKIEFMSCQYTIESVIEVRNFDSNVSKAVLMRYPNQFLPEDTLSLQFTCTFSKNVIDVCIVNESEVLANLRRTVAGVNENSADCTGEPEINQPNESRPVITISEALHRLGIVDEGEAIVNIPRTTAAVSEISETSSVIDEPEINQPTEQSPSDTISHALQEVLNEGFLPDFDLRVGDRVFPVHKVILGSRSRVFRAMFTTEMKEKSDNYVNIQDLDEDTLQRLLQFVYSDKIDEDMGSESASSLYVAADKYALESLKQRCSAILQSGFCVSSVLEVLSLADMYQDKDLKSAALDFISLKEQDIIDTDPWKEFEEENAKLALETCRKLLSKKNNS